MEKLVGWARAVKARRRAALPVLWLFTDARRLPDPLPAARGLPPGLGGVVYRPEGVADPVALGRALARLCRARRLALVVAGDPHLAARLGAGTHRRGGRPAVPAPLRRCGALVTASAHDRAELWRGCHYRADLVFLSPLFPTASHPGARALGACRWASLARSVRTPVAALGGISDRLARALPRRCAAAGAITGLLQRP